MFIKEEAAPPTIRPDGNLDTRSRIDLADSLLKKMKKPITYDSPIECLPFPGGHSWLARQLRATDPWAYSNEAVSPRDLVIKTLKANGVSTVGEAVKPIGKRSFSVIGEIDNALDLAKRDSGLIDAMDPDINQNIMGHHIVHSETEHNGEKIKPGLIIIFASKRQALDFRDMSRGMMGNVDFGEGKAQDHIRAYEPTTGKYTGEEKKQYEVYLTDKALQALESHPNVGDFSKVRFVTRPRFAEPPSQPPLREGLVSRTMTGPNLNGGLQR